MFVTCQAHKKYRELHLNFCPIHINSLSIFGQYHISDSHFIKFRHMEKFLNKLKHFQYDLTDDVKDNDDIFMGGFKKWFGTTDFSKSL